MPGDIYIGIYHRYYLPKEPEYGMVVRHDGELYVNT